MTEHHTVIKIKNPLTNRMIHFGTPLYAKLVREGVIEPYVPEVKTPPSSPSVRNKRQSPEPIKRLQPKLTETLVETVADHRDQFNRDLTQEQTDRLLRKMLYEKLCLNDDKPEKEKSKKSKKPKKKVRFKIKKPKTPPPSSSDESSSESSEW